MRRRRIFKVAVSITAGVALLTAAGFVWLRSTPFWAGITLFSESARVENFRAMDKVFPYRSVPASEKTWRFGHAPRLLPKRYMFAGKQRDLREFLDRTMTTGLLVVHRGSIAHEEYSLGASETSKFTSWSIAKSVMSALIGVAVDQGHIKSIADPVDRYVPALRASDYGSTTIENVLTMSSGIQFDENYDDPLSDVNMLFISFATGRQAHEILADKARIRPQGTFNEYISSDTIVLGLVLEAATGIRLDKYLATYLWQPMGAEADAFWNTGASGDVLPMCCFNATLRDYARFGRLYLEDGRREGKQIIPSKWISASVQPTASRLQPGRNPNSSWTLGYDFHWWIPENPQQEFLAIGIWGQYIFVDRRRGVVVVKTSADPQFDAHEYESIAVMRAIASSLTAY